MLRHQGGDQVKAGFYFNLDGWEVTTLSGEGGMLAGPADTSYVRLPLPLLLVVAPLLGAAFAMFLPFIGIAMVLDYAAKRAWAAVRDAVHGTAQALGPQTRAGEAYFTGTAETKAKGEPAADTDARLKELEKAIDEHEGDANGKA
jgi:hypothetical protein